MQTLVRPLAQHHALTDSSARAPTAMIESAEAFAELVNSTPPEPFRLAWDEAPVTVWWEVVERYPHLSAWVAANRSVPHAVLAHLATHGNTQVRTVVASKAQLPEQLFLILAHDKDEAVRLRVAFNAQATPEVLATLAGDVCPIVRMHAQARLNQGLLGKDLTASYLASVSLADLLH
jgi:hypothetical protein